MSKKINIIIADDHAIVIDGVRSILSHEQNMSVIGTASNGEQAIEILRKNNVDVAILDIGMAPLDGIEATRIIKKEFTDVKVLILTMHDTIEFIDELIDAGAYGYILKNKASNEVVNAVNSLAAGKPYFEKAVMDKLLHQRMSGEKAFSSKSLSLTQREKEVLKLIAMGMTASEISEKLFISSSTVNTHRRNLIDKIGVRNTTGLVRYALENKLAN